MEGLRERINEIKDHYRLSNRGFATALGTKPAATNNYLNGTKEPLEKPRSFAPRWHVVLTPFG